MQYKNNHILSTKNFWIKNHEIINKIELFKNEIQHTKTYKNHVALLYISLKHQKIIK